MEVNVTKIVIDTENQGLDVVLKDYQSVAMQLIWEGGEYSSRDAWQRINEKMAPKGDKPAISRASVINFLNAMVEDGVLAYHEVTGKGGHRRIYKAGKTEQEFWLWLITLADSTLKEAAGLQILKPPV